MFTKTTTGFALFSIAARVAVASPPACLIAAVNTQSNPSVLKAVCSGSNATEVEQYICKNCGDSADTAMSVFSSICGSAGVTISNSTSCSSSSSSSSSASATATSSGASSSHGTATTNPSTTSFVGSGGILTAGSSSILTATSASSSVSGAPTDGAAQSSSSSSASGASSTASPSTGMAARLGMDIIGMIALGALGVMLTF